MITFCRLVELLRYNSASGYFYWKVKRGNVKIGQRAGSLHKYGYIHIKIDGKLYKGHRLAWLYVTGAIPPEDVEHRDRRKNNNRWKNLRLADDSLNQANVGPRRTNKCGYKGVFFVANRRWRAKIQVRKCAYHLGYFETPAKAHAAYVTAAKKHFGQFARAA